MRLSRIAHVIILAAAGTAYLPSAGAAQPSAPTKTKAAVNQNQTQTQNQAQTPAQTVAPIAPPPGAPAVVRSVPDSAPSPTPTPTPAAPYYGTTSSAPPSAAPSAGSGTRTSRTHTTRTSRPAWLENFYIDGGLTFGNARPTIPNVTDEPFMLQMGLSATVAYKVYAFLVNNTRVTLSLGLMPGYTFSGQYSSLDPTLGNFRGTRFQILTPTIVARIEDQWTLKLGVELSGAYNLSRPTYNGNSLDFGSPFGVSLTGMTSLAKVFKIPELYGGLQLEYTKFGTIEDSSLGSESLSSSIKFLEFGVAVMYAF